MHEKDTVSYTEISVILTGFSNQSSLKGGSIYQVRRKYMGRGFVASQSRYASHLPHQ